MPTIKPSRLLRAGIVLPLLLVTGCFSFSDRKIRPVTEEIALQMPALQLEKEISISVGAAMFNLLDVVTFNDVDISAMDHVQVAVYKVAHEIESHHVEGLDLRATLGRRDRRLNWETIVRVREPDEQVWILAGMDERRNTLEAIFVVSFERRELVLVNVEGKLERLLEFAMQPAQGHRGIVKT